MTSKEKLLTKIFTYLGRLKFKSRYRLAKTLAALIPFLLRRRAYIVFRNLEIAFPNLPKHEQNKLAKRHFLLLALSFIDRGLLWFGNKEQIINATPIEGLENLDKLLKEKKRIILLAPHFVGLDAAATRLTIYLNESATMYTSQSNAAVDNIVKKGRARFNIVHLVNRKDGIRALLRHLRKGTPVYYLPDMDFGRRGATFAPFFGMPASTLLATAQIARTWDAVLLPIISNLDENTGKYHVKVLPPINDFPGQQSNEEATARLNLLIEEWVRADPAQYYWVHRRYKTRPNKADSKIYQYQSLIKRKNK